MNANGLKTVKKHSLSCSIISAIFLVVLIILIIFILSIFPYDQIINGSYLEPNNDLSGYKKEVLALIIGIGIFALIVLILGIIMFVETILSLVVWFSSEECKNENYKIISILLIISIFVPILWFGIYFISKKFLAQINQSDSNFSAENSNNNTN